MDTTIRAQKYVGTLPKKFEYFTSYHVGMFEHLSYVEYL